MPWSCRILLRHHQTKKNSFPLLRPYAQTVFKVYTKVRKSAQFDIFVSSKFPTLNICRKSMKAQNGLKFLSELCFGMMNVRKDSYLLN